MVRMLIILMLMSASQIRIIAQIRFIEGTVYDEKNNPMVDAGICEILRDNCVRTDKNGKFRIRLSPDGVSELVVSYVGYYSKSVVLQDTIKYPIKVIMQEEYSAEKGKIYKPKINAFVGFMNTNWLEGKFNYTELNPKLVQELNQLNYCADFGIEGYFRNFYGAFGYGQVSDKSKEIDSVHTNIYASKINFKIGYGLGFKNNFIIFTPYCAFDLKYYRIQTRDSKSSIPLSTYLQSNYYDIKFQQWMCTLGGDLNIRIYTKWDQSLLSSLYLSFGAGYIFKITDRPLIQSFGNELTSSGKINYQNLILQIGMKWFVQD